MDSTQFDRLNNPELNELHALINDNDLLKLSETYTNPDFEYESNGPISVVVKRLFKAAEENDIYYIKTVFTNSLETDCKFIIKEPAVLHFDVNLADTNGITALYLASVNQNADAVQLLLSLGANPNPLTSDGTTCLTHCVLAYLERQSNGVSQGTHFMKLRDENGNIGLWNRAELEWSLNFPRQEDCDFTETSAEMEDHDESEDIDEEGYVETQMPEEFKMQQ
ncbi:unnamed protein product [Hymenolepis diminuta]|uniref:ANK_REP_REGION domain-containing protein n=1 Tax=Hymenolepis diminuta TaxID=6216 RepID=A0A0R3SQU1_HYMDI|nr:unnamed protein product [Hymenolepis diminuta]